MLHTNRDAIRYRFVKINAKWLRETYSYDVSKHLCNVNCPTLIISGEKDIQVNPGSAFNIAKLIKGKTESHIISNMNHLLRTYENKHHLLTLLKEYKKNVQQTLNNTFIQTLVQWLDNQKELIK